VNRHPLATPSAPGRTEEELKNNRPTRTLGVDWEECIHDEQAESRSEAAAQHKNVKVKAEASALKKRDGWGASRRGPTGTEPESPVAMCP